MAVLANGAFLKIKITKISFFIVIYRWILYNKGNKLHNIYKMAKLC